MVPINIMMLSKYSYKHQSESIEEQNKHKKCLINMWCGTGKTRTFTIDLFINNEKTNVFVFPSLGLINQYCNDYTLSNEEPFKTEFAKYKCLSFCSDNDGKLKSKGQIKFTTDENKLNAFLKKNNKQIILVTYQSFEKFITICIKKNIKINNLIFDEAHHIVGDKIQNVVFNNKKLDDIVDKTRYYTATPVNKNGITMYDRDDPENSDCGPLAYEYLYYQAVDDGICKSFETQISLYTQKTTYKNKYQPVFESIIRACLSGTYNYWNILTYHSFVNENEDMNDNISFVNDFASPENQKLVKKLFTTIQNEEFPETKDTYEVKNVILKGVHSETRNRHKIIKNFDQKVEGRIFILSSCGILNEGIDTKWANMGVPINPSKSIVKESQRIGRLVRIPEEGMSPAIMLIPCEVDITKYSSMDTPELRDQMIRQELSECGNFNTILNVISAFKYQYDPELFEMCLKYPNMYAPKEVKDNLAKQGLIVGDSQGNLLDNLKYVCGKEDIELDTEPFEDMEEEEILKGIAEECGKTIEIHTQNYDEPVKYINEDSVDEEPLRLFYCEDDNTYAPITKKDKKIKRRTTTLPIKRKQLFSIHTHPDLEVLWKIKEGSIDLNKTFCQGILDVDITWNVKNWEESLEKAKEFMDVNNKRPSHGSKNQEEKTLAKWISHQVTNYKKKAYIMNQTEIYDAWTAFINDTKYKEYFIGFAGKWFSDLEKVKEFMDVNNKRPNKRSENQEEKTLGIWISNQLTNYKKKAEIMKQTEIYNAWTAFITDSKYKEHFIGGEEKWFNDLEKAKEFMDVNNKRPNQRSKNQEEKTLANWIVTQLANYKKKAQIMKQTDIYDDWTAFIDDSKYKEYFIGGEEKWFSDLEKAKEFMDVNNKRLNQRSKNQEEKTLATWISTQLANYKKKSQIMEEKDIYDAWTAFINDPKYKEHFIGGEEKWFSDLEKAKEFMGVNNKRPNKRSENQEEKTLGRWIGTQLKNYKKKAQIMKQTDIYDAWTVFITDSKYKEHFTKSVKKSKKSMAKPEIAKKKKPETQTQRRVKSEMSILHQKYKTMTSQNLSTYFKEHPEKWNEYHQISKNNEESFPDDEIPRNKMIKRLENIPGTRKKVVVDLGCGHAEINHHFKDNNRFEFHNFDHHSTNEMVIVRDIKNTELEAYSVDICILSLAMWGSNCKDYLVEAYRILDTGGTLLISEAYKRWNKELDEQEKPINRLVKLLEEYNFTIIKNQEEKFMFIECRKNL